jgi:hypothetical protein
MTAAYPLSSARPMQPPYLVTTGTDRRGVSVGVTADASTTVVEMTVHGRWSPQLGDKVAVSLRQCLAGPCASIIIDLCDVGDLHGVSLPFWLAVGRAVRLRPAPVRLVLCLTPRTMLHYRLRHQDLNMPPVFDSMREARIAIAALLAHAQRLQARLSPHPASVPAARGLVRQACDAWDLLPLRDVASLIMSELAANAVEHARTDFVATVSKSASGLHLAVRDGVFHYPRLSEVAPGRQLDERGRGLRMIHAVAAAWGAMPARGGKVVWATVH